jgi:hypothetical protein
MNLTPFVKTMQKFLIDNSPGILTGFAVAGTVTTAVLAGKAGYSAAMMEVPLKETTHYAEDGTELSVSYDSLQGFEIVKLVWKEFIPAAIVGAATVTCVIGANHINSRRAAAIVAAFKLSEELANEYKEKVVKTLGAQKEEKMRADLAKERMDRVGGSETIIIMGSEVLFYDQLTGRFFKNEMTKVERAENEINYQINNYYHASLTDFYEKIGLSATPFSDEVGWNSDELLKVEYTATLQDNKPAIAIAFRTTPIRGYDRCS